MAKWGKLGGVFERLNCQLVDLQDRQKGWLHEEIQILFEFNRRTRRKSLWSCKSGCIRAAKLQIPELELEV